MIDKWWKASGEIGPSLDMLPEESTFLAYVGDIPALCVTIYLTNSPALCYVENFIGNPAVKGMARLKASRRLSDHIADFAKSKGYRNLLCLAHREPLKRRYQELGFIKTLDGVATFCRPL